jgi:hypothetical protein
VARNPKAVALILGRLGKKPAGGEASEEEAPSEDVGLESAAGDILTAIHNGDAGELAAALKSFHQQCSAAESSEEY